MWIIYPGRCPRCGGRMIENRKYIECSERHCDYILKTKSTEENFSWPSADLTNKISQSQGTGERE